MRLTTWEIEVLRNALQDRDRLVAMTFQWGSWSQRFTFAAEREAISDAKNGIIAALNPRSIVGQDSIELENLSQQKIVRWWNRADRHEFYPATDKDAVELCRSAEFAIDLESLVRFIDVGAFGDVSVSEGTRKWSATDIIRLACFLECRRAWQPGSELHHAKKTRYELELESHRTTGESHELFNDLEMYDLRALLLMLTEADNRQQPEAPKVAIEIKLEGFCITV